MIVYDLQCRSGDHRFEGWFRSSDDFARQQQGGLVACPHCGSSDVTKALQAPRLNRKGNQAVEPLPKARAKSGHEVAPSEKAHQSGGGGGVPAPQPLPAEAVEMVRKLAEYQAEALKSSRYVGKSFTEDARAMHYGEREAEPIHGQASLEEARELIEEGIGVMPLVYPAVPPEETN